MKLLNDNEVIMKELNENAGIIILIVGVIVVVLLGVAIWLLLEMKKRLAVQRLKFIGRFAADPDTRRMVAHITISNRSLSDMTLTELGIRNGKVNFNLTDTYKKQSKLNDDARVVVGQRDAIRFTLSAEDLVKALIQSNKGKIVLKKICVYAMDSTGILYVGKVADVKKLLANLAKNGVDYLPPAFDPKALESKPATAPASEPKSEAAPAQAEKPEVAPMPAIAPSQTGDAAPMSAPETPTTAPSGGDTTPSSLTY